MSVREDVLRMLTEADGDVSGEQMARRLNVSRNAIWKAVAQLREEGYQIDAGTNRGYRLSGARSPLSEAGIRSYLRTERFGRTLEVHKVIDSTNARVKLLAAEGAPEGMLVAARRQTSGRGRFRRAFHSPENAGVYFTLLLRPDMTADRAVMLTSMTAVAVARAIDALAGTNTQIKWVNDLYLGGKKICGILCEAGMDFESGRLDYAAVGIGINTAPQVFPEELQDIATSIGNVTGRDISGNQLVAEVCAQMEALYPALTEGGFMDEYRERSNVIGRRVKVIRGNEHFSGTAVGIDDDGSLIVDRDGDTVTVRSGEISIRLEEDGL